MQIAIKRRSFNPACTVFVDPATTDRLFDDGVERDALGHWLLGSDYPGYEDLISAQTLTEIAAAPTLGSNYLQTANTGLVGNGLETPFDDSADMTITAVIEIDQSGAAVFDSWNASLDEGKALYEGVGSTAHTMQFVGEGIHAFGPSGGSAEIEINPPFSIPASPTTWAFVAASFSSERGTILYWGNGNHRKNALSNTPNSSGPICLGNAGNFSAKGPCKYAEFIVYDYGLTLRDLQVRYARSKARLSGRSITVY